MGRDCPNCGGTGTVVNEIDDSVCCDNCGTVLREFDLIDYEEDHVYRKDREKEYVIKTTFVQDRFEKVGRFFSLEEDLIAEGKVVVKKYGLHVNKKFVNEACLGIVCSIGKHLKSGWIVDDYIAAFPYPIFKPALLKIYGLVEGPGVDFTQSMYSPERQFDYSMDKVYPMIVVQLFGSGAVSDVFNKDDLKLLTSQFMALARMYGLNIGKKSRSVITVSACLCALYLRTKIPIRKRKREKVKKENYRHKWDFSAFKLLVFTTNRYLTRLYYDYFRLLVACVKKIPWIEDTNDERYSFYHLEDVLTVFVKKEGEEEPMMKLEPRQFDPPSYVRNRTKDDILVADIEAAKALIEQDIVPENRSSMVYSIHKLLTNGYDEEELLTWTVGNIRNAAAMLDFRFTFNSRDETNNDLDRVLIGEDDMTEAELEAYLN